MKIDKTKLKYIIITSLILTVGILLHTLLVIFKKSPTKAPKPKTAPLVTIEQVNLSDLQMVVSGFGTVKSRVEVEIAPQVSGNVIEIHPEFKSGGFIKKGDMIIRIEPKDYELAVRQAKAAVAQAQVQLEIEQAEASVARAEWDQLNPGVEPTSPLVLREPQIRQAEANLESAKATLEKAELNLSRTKVTMPIDICIASDNIDLGQYASAAMPIGAAFGIEKAEVTVPLEDKDLRWFDIPSNSVSSNGNSTIAEGADAEIVADFAGRQYKWQGKVVRTTGQVDEKSRLINVVIEIDKPFHTNGRPALLPGMFVEAFIKGQTINKAFKISRETLHNSNEVWVAIDGKLKVVELDIIRLDEKYAYADSGIKDGDLIVTSQLEIIIDGMDIRYDGLENPADINDVNIDPNAGV